MMFDVVSTRRAKAQLLPATKFEPSPRDRGRAGATSIQERIAAHSRSPDTDTHIRRTATTRFEEMAGISARITGRRSDMLGLLLAGLCASPRQGPAVLWPLWANEGMHRADGMVRLVARLERERPAATSSALWLVQEILLANTISSALAALAACEQQHVVPCSAVVRETVRNMVELFGPAIGNVSVRTAIDSMMLPAFQRRALALLTVELVMNCLLHAFVGRRVGEISVSVLRCGGTRAVLTVTDTGLPTPATEQLEKQGAAGIGFDLASLLGSELTYRRAPSGGLSACAAFAVVA